MVSFLIGPYKPIMWETANSDLRIDPEWYRKRLQERWPDIRFFQALSSFILEWDIPVTKEGAGILGGLLSDRQIVYMDTPFEDLILWHRSVVPSRYTLYLFREGAWDYLELTPETSIEDLENFIGRRD